jgi:hypothetical protein
LRFCEAFWSIRKSDHQRYENNYGGAIKRLNAITARLTELDLANATVLVLNGLKCEELTQILALSNAARRVFSNEHRINPYTGGCYADAQ